MAGSTKKPKATPVTNPCGLTAREVEIAILAWKCQGEDGKIDNKKLADLARITLADSAGRMWRGIKAKIIAATTASENSAAPGTPATADGDNDAAVLGATDPASPSVMASKKKSAGRIAGRKRTKKEAGGDEDGGGETGDNNSDAEGGERPKKIPKHVKSGRIITLKENPSDVSHEMKTEDGEV